MHRDIKPTNIVRAPDGKIAIVDFGGVLEAARDKGGSTIVGTYGYMAPEQLHGQVTPAADIYSLGATIVALAGGIEPEDVARKGLRMDLDRHLPTIDDGLRAALTAMTDPDPDKRPQRDRLYGGFPDLLSARRAPNVPVRSASSSPTRLRSSESSRRSPRISAAAVARP